MQMLIYKEMLPNINTKQLIKSIFQNDNNYLNAKAE